MKNWFVDSSKIHGVGVFINKDIPPNTFIDIAIDTYGNVTPFGSKINHSWTPSTRLVYNNITRMYDIYSIKDMNKNSEITADYTYTPSFIRKPNPSWK
jgi:hypothetical protein